VRVFAEAELVVAVHGAALTNLAFCPPGALVVELFAPDYVNVCYWALACQVEGLRYRYLVGRGRAPEPGAEMMGVASDLDIDLDALAALLDQEVA
jgi:capsular polysaccharide biosynthesis protein